MVSLLAWDEVCSALPAPDDTGVLLGLLLPWSPGLCSWCAVDSSFPTGGVVVSIKDSWLVRIIGLSFWLIINSND